MTDDMKGKKLRAVVDLGALGVAAGAEFTVTKKMTERADFDVLLEIGAVEAVRQAKVAGPAKPAPQAKTEAEAAVAGSLIHGSGTIHFLDEIEVTCALNAAEVMIDRSVVDARTFCGNEQVPGERVPGTTFGGFGYWGGDEYEDALTARMQSGADVDRLSIFGTTAGSRTYEVLGPLTKESHAWKATEILGLSGEIAKGEKLTRGVALEVSSTITATGAQTGQQHETTTAGQVFVAVFRLKSVSGAGSVTFGIDESQDDGGGDAYSAIAGISAVFTAPGIQRLTTTSATELWKRLNVTAFSGFTSVVATVTVGIQMPD